MSKFRKKRKIPVEMEKRKNLNYSREALNKAIKACKDGEQTPYRASKNFNVPKSTLHNRLKGRHSKSYGRPTELSKAEENTLVSCILTSAEWGRPIPPMAVRRIVKNYLDRQGVSARVFKNNMPGYRWYLKFRDRHKRILNISQSEVLCSEECSDRMSTNLTDIASQSNGNSRKTNKDIPRKKSKGVKSSYEDDPKPYIVYKGDYVWKTWTPIKQLENNDTLEPSQLPRKKLKKKTKQLAGENDSAFVEEMFTAFEQIFRDGRFSEKYPISKEYPKLKKIPATKIVKKTVRKHKPNSDPSNVPGITEIFSPVEETKLVTPTSLELEIIDGIKNEKQPDSKYSSITETTAMEIPHKLSEPVHDTILGTDYTSWILVDEVGNHIASALTCKIEDVLTDEDDNRNQDCYNELDELNIMLINNQSQTTTVDLYG